MKKAELSTGPEPPQNAAASALASSRHASLSRAQMCKNILERQWRTLKRLSSARSVRLPKAMAGHDSTTIVQKNAVELLGKQREQQACDSGPRWE